MRRNLPYTKDTPMAANCCGSKLKDIKKTSSNSLKQSPSKVSTPPFNPTGCLILISHIQHCKQKPSLYGIKKSKKTTSKNCHVDCGVSKKLDVFLCVGEAECTVE